MPEYGSSRRRNTLIFWWVVSLLPIAGIILSLSDPAAFYTSQERYRQIIGAAGLLGPIAFIALQAAQVVFTPINHYAVGVAGGFLFGPSLGGALNWVGRVLGHMVAFLLSRRFARPLVKRRVSDDALLRYDRLIGERPGILFLVYFLPFFPDDEISYLVGLSRMHFSRFMIVNLLGHVGGSWSLAYVGAGVDKYDWFFWSLVGLTIVGFLSIAWLTLRQGKRDASD